MQSLTHRVARLIGLALTATALAACSFPVAFLPTAQPTPNPYSPSGTAVLIPESVAQAFFDALMKADYAGAERDFNATMQSKFPPEALKQSWEALPGQVGAYQKLIKTRTESQNKYRAIIYVLQFEKAAIDLRVVVDTTSGQIGGLFFQPAKDTTPGQATPQASLPSYADPSTFSERDVTVGSAPWALSGTLSMPTGAGPFPAVVLVAGSGPNDRDETAYANKPFRDLAWGLASKGIAVLRYDKRTLRYGQQMIALPGGFTVDDEVTDDAVSAVALLRQTSGVDPKRVFVLGHSLGGMMAPRIAKTDPDVRGLVIMAGATRPLASLMVTQTEYLLSLDPNPSDQAKAAVEQLKQQVATVQAITSSNAPSSTQPILGAPPQYWLDLNGYHPAELARTLSQPMLILQGERDYQVTMTDFKGWQDALSGRSNVQVKTYPDLNHLFMAGQGKSTPAEYQQPGHVSQAVVDDIAKWVSAN